MSSAAVSPSVAGKKASEENFPVASLLLPKAKRAVIMTYYRFARHADDVADSPDPSPEQKVAGLDALDRALHGEETGPALVLAEEYRRVVNGDSTMIGHASQLLVAFRRDALRNYCEDWADLLEYCRYSAAPVGRFLLDLHGEDHDAFGPSDALCAALQVLNHLQDCAKDLRNLNRVYIPRDRLAAAGLTVSVLQGAASPPALRRVIDELLDDTDEQIRLAQPLPGLIRDTRLRLQAGVTVRVAEALSAKLRHGDPLAERVRLSGLDYAGVFVTGILRGLFAR